MVGTVTDKDIEKLRKRYEKPVDLGTYEATHMAVSARLHLTAQVKFYQHTKGNDTGYEVYHAEACFSRKPNNEQFEVKVEYEETHFSKIFGRLRIAEEGIEKLLGRSFDNDNWWKEHREVLKCIFSLEEKTKHLESQIKEAYCKRAEELGIRLE